MCVRVCTGVCPSARGRGASGLGPRGAPDAGLPADWGGPTRPCANACGAALCVSERGPAPPTGSIFCFARDRHIKGKAAAARRRPLSLRCPRLQVYYYSTGRAASPRGLAACRAVQRPGRLHAWRAPKPPPPPPYLSEKQPHVEAEKPAGGGGGRPGCVRAVLRGGAGAARRSAGAPASPGARRAQRGRREGRAGRGARWPLPLGPESPIPAE